MADAGRVPGPTVEEKEPLVERVTGAVGRDMVEDEYELPLPCALVVAVACRVTDPGLLVSGFAVFGRVASGAVSSRCANDSESSIRDMLIALFAIVPGAMIPERELVVAELASRRPACGRRIRVDALVVRV
jgi:hypothetical protein